MPIGEICNRSVVVVEREHSVRAAAALMREHHVGTLVVVTDNGTRKPVGIVTDRDITIGVVAVGLDADVLTVGDIMGPELFSAPEDQGVSETLRQMREHGIRRLPIVDRQAALVGLVSLDDMLELLAEELGELARLIAREQSREEKQRR
jgi:CBS domain-containing protein